MTSQHGACNAAGRLRATALYQSGGAGVDGGPLKARGAQDKQGVWSWAKSLRISLRVSRVPRGIPLISRVSRGKT